MNGLAEGAKTVMRLQARYWAEEGIFPPRGIGTNFFVEDPRTGINVRGKRRNYATGRKEGNQTQK